MLALQKTKEIPENGNHKKTYALKSQSLSTSGSAGRRNGWGQTTREYIANIIQDYPAMVTRRGSSPMPTTKNTIS